MGSSTVVRHERQEVSSTVSPRVESSSPVRGRIFADFFSLIQFWQIWQHDLFTENLEYCQIWLTQECIPVGSVPATRRLYAGSALGGGVCVCSGGCLVWGVCSWGGVWSRGSAPGGGCLLGGSAPGGCLLPGAHPSMHWGRHPPPCGQNSWHTLVKILPWPNFVAAGKNRVNEHAISLTPREQHCQCTPLKTSNFSYTISDVLLKGRCE